MATIKARKQGDGVMRYTAIVRIRRGGKILHRESKTFAHRSAAISWAKHRGLSSRIPPLLPGCFENEPLERVASEFNRYAQKPIEITTRALRIRVSQDQR